MRKLSMILVALTIIVSSCTKDTVPPSLADPTPETASFTMTYDGVTYTNAEVNSLILSGGNLSASSDADGFVLAVSGVGVDGSTTDVCHDPEVCNPVCTITLMVDPANGDSFIAESGTVARNGKTIEINAIGLHDPNVAAKTLTATIVVGQVIEY